MGKRPRVLVVGSINVDLTVSTDVFPKEGETVSGNGFKKAAGGKGANQAVQLARLGASVTMVGAVGDDSDGREMIELLSKEGIDTSFVVLKEGVATGCAVIVLHGGQNRIIVYAGANGALEVSDVHFLEKEISKYDMVVLQLEIPMEINEAVAKYAYDSGVPVFLNTAPYAPLSDELLSRVKYLSPNETEAESLTGVKISGTDVDEIVDKAKTAVLRITERGVKNAIITLGSNGAYFGGIEESIYSPAVGGVKAIDPTAAGDSFIGGFVYEIANGASVSSALNFANHTAAITVSRMGAIPSLPTLEEVQNSLKNNN